MHGWRKANRISIYDSHSQLQCKLWTLPEKAPYDTAIHFLSNKGGHSTAPTLQPRGPCTPTPTAIGRVRTQAEKQITAIFPQTNRSTGISIPNPQATLHGVGLAQFPAVPTAVI